MFLFIKCIFVYYLNSNEKKNFSIHNHSNNNVLTKR